VLHFVGQFGSHDNLREIVLIEQRKQPATRGPSSSHAVGAGEFRRKLLLPEIEGTKFGYGVHWLPLSSPRLFRAHARISIAVKAAISFAACAKLTPH
jgi:hypothetical protein